MPKHAPPQLAFSLTPRPLFPSWQMLPEESREQMELLLTQMLRYHLRHIADTARGTPALTVEDADE
jgi:hypothetical protein